MPYTRRRALALAGALLAGCTGQTGRDTGEEATPVPAAARTAWYPHPQPSGNRRLAGAGNVRDARPVDIPVADPEWLVALPAPAGSDWVVAGDGEVARYRVSDGDATRQERYGPAQGVPAVRRRSDDTGASPALVRPPTGASRLAPPTVTDDGSRLAVGTDGGLLVDGQRRALGTLPDGRIVRLAADRYALLGDATDRYRHGALGDTVEGGSLVVVDGSGAVRTRSRLAAPAVVEAQAPLAADIDGDGEREMLAPVSDASDGARIAAFSPDGSRLATGPIHGSGWRHPLAVAPFAPDGRPELAVVRKPHVEHVLEFYRLDGGRLRVVATLAGFRSHTYGSRTLDGAVAADVDEDGAVELLLPTTARDELAAVRRTTSGARVVWRRSLPGQVRTNLTGVALEDRVAVGVGTAGGVRVWQG